MRSPEFVKLSQDRSRDPIGSTPQEFGAFFDQEPGTLVQVAYEDVEVLGVLQRIPRLEWGVVTEKHSNFFDTFRRNFDVRIGIAFEFRFENRFAEIRF